MSKIHIGTLVNFYDGKGYGFIKPRSGGKDIFAHLNQLRETGTGPVFGKIPDQDDPDFMVPAEGTVVAFTINIKRGNGLNCGRWCEAPEHLFL